MKRTRLLSLLLRLADVRAKRSRIFEALSLAVGALFFLALLPAIFLRLSQAAGAALAPAFPSLWRLPQAVEIGIAVAGAVCGLFLLAWAALTQWRHGEGTPAQIAPTRRLVTNGPYALCRNPIELGAILYYLAFGATLGSFGNGLLCALLAALIGSAWHRFVEERELAARFGAEYAAYREKTPFIIPRFRK